MILLYGIVCFLTGIICGAYAILAMGLPPDLEKKAPPLPPCRHAILTPTSAVPINVLRKYSSDKPLRHPQWKPLP